MKDTHYQLCLITLICLQEVTSTAAAAPAAKPSVSVVSLAAGSATQYNWAVSTATYPSGLSLKVGSHVGSLLISTNFTRTVAGTVGVVSGLVKVDNPGDISLLLSQVQVLVQQPAAGQAPFRSIAECKLNEQGLVAVDAQRSIVCPFAVQLAGSTTAPVAVVGQAMVIDGAQLSSYPMMAVSSSSSTSSKSLELGRCAVMTDTFMPGQLYLVPDRVSAGMKLPALGGGMALCGNMTSLYRVSFGPYAGTVKCGTYKVMNTARVNPLGGSQSPVLASSLVLMQLTNCPSAAAPSVPPPVHSTSQPLGASTRSSSSSIAPIQTVVYGPPSSPSPVYMPAVSAAAPAEVPAPVPASTPPATGGGYYYTYEYEATVPTGKRRRLQQQSSRAGGSTGASSENSSNSERNGVKFGPGDSSSSIWPSGIPAWARDQSPGHHGDRIAEVAPVSKGKQLQQLSMQYLQQEQQLHKQAEQLAPQHPDSGLLPAAWQAHTLLADEPSSRQQHQAAINWGQLYDAMQFGYQLEQQVTAGNSSVALLSNVRQQAWHQQPGLFQGSSSSSSLATDAKARSVQQQSGDFLEVQVPVHADSREKQLKMRHQRRSLRQAAPDLAMDPSSGSAYYTTSAPDPVKPSIALGNVMVDYGVVAYSWQPKVAVSRAAVTVPVGKIALLQYSVKVLRSELPMATLLRGSVVLKNPVAGVLKLTEVAVEAPAAGFVAWAYTSVECPHPNNTAAASAASAAANVVTVPARGQLVCSFTLSYPAAAPAKGQVYARAVTEAGRELISTVYTFIEPATKPAAAKAVNVGDCALFSDSFLTSADSPVVMPPSLVPASGSKAPAAASDAGTRGYGGVVLCNSAAFAYTATLGPYRAGQCGVFKVVSHLRVRPLNGSTLPTSAATATVTVNITGCPTLGSIAAANAVSAATINQNASSYSAIGANGAKLALPLVTLQPLELRPVTSYVWTVSNTPIASDIKFPYRHVHRAGFMVQYKRNPAPPGVTISGFITIRNPNLLDALSLAQVQVEMFMTGSTGPVARTWAACPRDDTGVVVVSGQLVGVGTIVCSWSMELAASGSFSDLVAAGGGAHLMAVAVTSTGREGASAATPLAFVPVNSTASPAGACAALSNGFQLVGPGGQQLMVPSGSNSSNTVRAMAAVSVTDLLPGEAGGGRAADVVCDSLSLSYGANYGPLNANQCGTSKTINVAVASPTTGQGSLGTAAGASTVDVTSCPGAGASLRITALQLQLVKATLWNVTGQASASASSAVQVSVGSTADVAFGLRYLATAALPVRQAVGTVSVHSSGSSTLSISQLLLDVMPVSDSSVGQSALVTWTASCPGDGSGSVASLAAGSSIVCSFSGLVPETLVGSAAVVARLQLPHGVEIASPASVLNFIKSPPLVVHKARCAIVADQFLSGPGLLMPGKTSRPASAASATQICNSQSVSYVATLGPFTKAQCGQPLGVVNIARVNPVSTSAVQLPVSIATMVGVNVTGGCSRSSTRKKR